MVIQGELIVKMEGIGKGVGEFFGGAKLAGTGKQAEAGSQTGASLAGGAGMKALLGSEGFGGLKKSMVGMTGPVGKLGGALMKGGVIGMATGGITAIMGIVSKALGSSSIFTGVAAQFWKIAGVMVDMLLMPLLPYMMKFIQWMMTKVMPQVMKISEGIGRALQGDIGPLLSAYFGFLAMMFKDVYLKLPRLFMDVIVVAIKNALPFMKDTTVKEYRQERKDKKLESEGTEAQQANMGWREKSGILTQDTVMGQLMDKFKIINNVSNDFSESLVADAAKTGEKLARFTATENNKGRAQWAGAYDELAGGSILPDIKDNTLGFMDSINKEAGGVSDFLFGWIGKIDWSVFGNIGGAILDAAKSVYGAITGFFTGKDSEGAEVTPSIMSILPGLPSFPKLSEIGIVKTITDKAKEIWGSVDTFFTETIPGWIPTWSEIYTGITDGVKGLGNLLGAAKDAIVDKVKDLWGTWNPSGIMGIIPDLLSNIPGFEAVYSAAKNAVGGIANLLGDATSALTGKVKDIWGQWSTTVSSEGVETTPNGIAGIIPNLIGKLPSFSTIFSMKTYTDLGTKAKNFLTGKLKAIWGQWSESTDREGAVTEPNGIAGIIPNLLGRIPSFKTIFSLDTYKDLGTLAKNKVTEILGNIWGDWGDKTGIAGLIPNLMSKIPDFSAMFGDLMTITFENVNLMDSKKFIDKYGGKIIEKKGGVEGEGSGMGDIAYDMEIGITDLLKAMGGILKEKAMTPLNWFKDIWAKLRAKLDEFELPSFSLGGLLTGLKNAAVGGLNSLIGWINTGICSIVDGWNNMSIFGFDMGKFTPDIKAPQIPLIGGGGGGGGGTGSDIIMHQGGLIPGGPNTNVPTTLQGGEMVLPRNRVAGMQAGGGGGNINQTFNININSNFSPGDIVKSITQSGATDEVAYLNTVG